jgi:energy-converting hydrogenase Eha subunit G
MPTRDRIYVSKSVEVQAIYDKLKEEKGDDPKKPPTKPFRFDRDIFLAAAAMGYATGKYAELESSERKDKFLWTTLLADEHALAMLRTLALVHTSTPEVLLDDDKVASIAEAYANGGIRVLAKKLDSATDEIDEAMIFLTETLAALDTDQNQA